MSISALSVEAVPGSGVDVRALVADIEASLRDGVSACWDGLADSEVLDLVGRIGRLGSQLAGLRLAGLAEADRRQAARRAGMSSTGAWLHSTGIRAGAAHRDVELAHQLEQLPATREALGEGAISPEHAAVVARTVHGMADEVGDEARAAAERMLLDQAGRMDPTDLAKEAPGVARRVDPTAAARLAQREREARERRQLALMRDRDGDFVLAGRLDAEGAATLSAALDPLAAPAPRSKDGPDPRSSARRLADALVELARRAMHGSRGAGPARRLPDAGGERPQLVVTVTLDQLRAGVGAIGEISGGLVREPLSGAGLRKLACDAHVIPAVLGGGGEVLDLGRARRTASPAQRRALRLRDRGCIGPGCDRPPSWCQPHHIVHWADGGPTDLTNLVLLCTTHHDLVHHGRWTVSSQGGQRRMHPPPDT